VSELNKRTTRATGAAALDEAMVPTSAYQIEEIRLHLSVPCAVAEDLTIQLDSGVGAAYDTTFVQQNMNGVQNVVWQPSRPLLFNNGDELDITFPNTGNATWGLEIFWSPIF
jgi:hypothetical protein